LGYYTRPIWDKPPPSWDVLVHYYSPHFTEQEYCEAHQWSWIPIEQRPMVYDAVIFSTELDMLEIRMRELWDVVDRFLVLESDKTFTGRDKKLVLQENIEAFAWAKEKLLHLSFTGLDPSPKDPFHNEGRQRQAMNELIASSGIRNGDLLIMSDLDELPSANAVQLVKTCQGWPDGMHFGTKQYMYSFEFFMDFEG
jgi:beta-1,4-mannosyl-glycoprotein beta-1,4-N-acetylglucosaminyltransferase